jgi:uncharacterized cupin superfamily protein
MTGGVRVSDYYNYGYGEAKDSHYSLDFYQMIEPEKVGEDCQLFLRRDFGKKIVDRVVAKTTGKDLLRARVKVVILPSRYEEDGWDMFELLDIQFGTADNKNWEPWFVDAAREADAEAAENAKQAVKDAAKQKLAAQHLAKENERANRTRTWKDTTGKFSVVAEYSGTANGVVTLRKKDGKITRVPIERLCDDDRKWLEQRRKESMASGTAVK